MFRNSEAFTALMFQVVVFWVPTPCRDVVVYLRIEEFCYHDLNPHRRENLNFAQGLLRLHSFHWDLITN